MFGLFKKKDPIVALEEKYKKLSQQAYEMSHYDRTGSDAIYVKAHEVELEIQKLVKEKKTE